MHRLNDKQAAKAKAIVAAIEPLVGKVQVTADSSAHYSMILQILEEAIILRVLNRLWTLKIRIFISQSNKDVANLFQAVLDYKNPPVLTNLSSLKKEVLARELWAKYQATTGAFLQFPAGTEPRLIENWFAETFKMSLANLNHGEGNAKEIHKPLV